MPREPTKSKPVYQHPYNVAGPRSVPPMPSTQGADVQLPSQDACGCTMCSRTPPVAFDRKYRDEGDSFVVCGNTAFQVHSFLLTRDSLAFRESFRAAAEESVRHKNMLLIFVHQHSAQKMRNLLWVLYLLPQKLKTFNAKASDIPSLTNAALMAEAFRFESVQKWILMVLATYAERAQERDDHQILKAADLIILYQVATRCKSEKLLAALENYWIFLIKCDVKASNPAGAISLAERFDRPQFRGRAFYGYLVELWPDALQKCQLSSEQAPILVRGFYSLCRTWEEIRSSPEMKYCSHRNKEEVLNMAPADVLGKLRLIQAELVKEQETWGREFRLYNLKDTLQAVGLAIRKVENALPSYFK